MTKQEARDIYDLQIALAQLAKEVVRAALTGCDSDRLN